MESLSPSQYKLINLLDHLSSSNKVLNLINPPVQQQTQEQSRDQTGRGSKNQEGGGTPRSCHTGGFRSQVSLGTGCWLVQ